MSTARRIRWVVLLAGLVAAVTWLVRSVIGLSHSANNYGNQIIKAEWNTTRPSAAVELGLRHTQEEWGQNTMTAVAVVAFTLILIFIHAFLHDPRKDRSRPPAFPVIPIKKERP